MKESLHFAHLQSIDQSAPSNKFVCKIIDIPRKHGSLIFQLHTGHITLNKHLYHIARAPSVTCPDCNAHKELVHHYLLVCPKYTRQYTILRLEVGPCQLNIKYLLSKGKGIRATLKYTTWTK
ncbi:hypothetical protein BDR05DRAFT_892100 [Suillus weaverae]|nr:hypothetical protein BDR05DRAFT_892100 [Suillus weaverae]